MSLGFNSIELPQKFTVTTRRGHHLSCLLDLPSVTSTPRSNKPQLGILCHGLYQTKNSSTIVAASEGLLKLPTKLDAIVRFDFHGEGESDGAECWSLGGYEDEVEDLRDVIVFLLHQSCKVKLLLGHSRAATVVELYANKYGDVPLIIVVAGRLHLHTGINAHVSQAQKQLVEEGQSITIADPFGRKRQVTPECISRRVSLDMKSKLEELRDNPKQLEAVCIIHGDNDSAIPINDSIEAYDILKEKRDDGPATSIDIQFCKLDGAGHDIGKSKVVHDYHQVLRRFVEAHLVAREE